MTERGRPKLGTARQTSSARASKGLRFTKYAVELANVSDFVRASTGLLSLNPST